MKTRKAKNNKSKKEFNQLVLSRLQAVPTDPDSRIRWVQDRIIYPHGSVQQEADRLLGFYPAKEGQDIGSLYHNLIDDIRRLRSEANVEALLIEQALRR